MKSLENIKKDLKTVKEIKTLKSNLTGKYKIIIPDKVLSLVKEYDDVMKTAPPNLQIIYSIYYGSSITVKELMELLNISRAKIVNRFREMYKFLSKKIKED